MWRVLDGCEGVRSSGFEPARPKFAGPGEHSAGVDSESGGVFAFLGRVFTPGSGSRDFSEAVRRQVFQLFSVIELVRETIDLPAVVLNVGRDLENAPGPDFQLAMWV